ncbi:hypothetical protein LAZ67_14000575 [Cordylochernes scorpioides]|uniref:Transposase n=1 Tax=Cordylochernes scorpioides TaxID=51811 RepID=A0ABY6L5N9_9ARAC|nr:hypothetical protein LAZ67_14000575 [Cordylochernes scorpioides]
MEQKLKQRICIEFCVKLQISATETFEMLNKAFPNDAPKRTTVFEWHSRFKAGRISIEDDPRKGRPKFQRTDENVQKITDLIKENPRTTLLELEQDTGISKTTIGRIVTEYLKLKKTPAKFIPRFLTNEQKLCRLATCEDMMEMTRTDPEWKDKIITGDETWVYGYDPETKPQSAEWRVMVAVYACGVDVEKGPFRQQLWNAPPCDNVESWFGAHDSRSPLLRIQGTMTAQRYVDDVLRPVTLPYLQGVPNALYQQDNARPHTARISQQALQDVQMLPWPPYSPDLSPIEHVWDIIGRRLNALPQPRSEDELWQMVEREWRAIPQDAIRTLIDSLPRRVAACIAVRGGPTCY